MEWFRICAVVFTLALHSLCSPVDVHRLSNKGSIVSDDKDQLSGDDTILDHIEKVNKGDDVNLYEADIQLSPDDAVDLRNDGDVDGAQIPLWRKRTAARDRKKLWVTRAIPYVYGSGLPDSYKATIQQAIAEFESNTCLRFVKRTSEDLFIRFVHEKGCWSPVGRQYCMSGIGQQLSLGPGCNYKGTIMHVLMHAIGFWHKQSRTDRNLYEEVLWENIADGEEHNFNKYSHHDIDALHVPYDFYSIMHYGRKTFSKNGKDTIRSILDPNQDLGQRQGFSKLDVVAIQELYNCAGNGPWTSWSAFGPCSIYCYKLRQRFCHSSNTNQDCPEADQYGVQLEQVKCTNDECFEPIDGHWGRWSSWGQCSAECGFGKHIRTRLCDNPTAKSGGKACVGSSHSSEVCKLKSCEIGPDDCEFDNDGMCHWKNDPNNPPVFHWERHVRGTPSSSTGPSGDHTSGSGYYIYVETSGVPAGNKAKLLSRIFPPTAGRCLTFWYHMYGSGMGELNVYIKPVTGTLRKVWSLSGDQGDAWNMVQATLISSASQYQLAFEAVRGSSFRSDIGLDDISFKESPCSVLDHHEAYHQMQNSLVWPSETIPSNLFIVEDFSVNVSSI